MYEKVELFMKKDSSGLNDFNRWSKTIIAGIILGVLIVVLAANWRTFYKIFIPPKPTLIEKGSDDASTLMDYGFSAWAIVRNDGGAGNITMEATSYINDKRITKTVERYFSYKETARMTIVFNEATLLGKNSNILINVYPTGK